MDNAYPYFPFIALYPENCISSHEEYEEYSRFYLSLYYNQFSHSSFTKDEYIESELKGFMENLYCSMVLDGYYWAVGSILLMDEDKINEKVFNYANCTLRLKITKHLLTMDFIKDVIEKKYLFA
mmetsp:Transcript_30855/g.27289  ORF Transcript_30855/g.27289 Transcript_30855/m.27289 type:complete len:124 (+) Transcript_30855:254-625(+)